MSPCEFDAFLDWADEADEHEEDEEALDRWRLTDEYAQFKFEDSTGFCDASERDAFLLWAPAHGGVAEEYHIDGWNWRDSDSYDEWKERSSFRRWRFNRDHPKRKDVDGDEWDAFEDWEREEQYCQDDNHDGIEDSDAEAVEEAYFEWRQSEQGRHYHSECRISEWMQSSAYAEELRRHELQMNELLQRSAPACPTCDPAELLPPCSVEDTDAAIGDEGSVDCYSADYYFEAMPEWLSRVKQMEALPSSPGLPPCALLPSAPVRLPLCPRLPLPPYCRRL
eukprot:6541401-Prymnesium_polylepis.2